MKATALILLALCACEVNPEWRKPLAVDQCLRQQIFESCLKVVPKGPESVVSNDWDEVVSECDDAARRQSIRYAAQVTDTCKSTSEN